MASISSMKMRLHRDGDHAAATRHWREAHTLDPANWAFKRNASNFEDPGRQGPTAVYEGSCLQELKKIGGDNYYPAVMP